ncbi:carboxymuconolactone decarboxylase family protein [Mycobacterium sp.]|uniref:carboxymuconolactone decarboxylase family protein n=1 Tax=Mycobacterium sp. TaxID=1785 RepID=UPI003C76CFED
MSTAYERESRIPDGDFRKLGLVNWLIAKIAARVLRVSQMHLFTTLGQHKRLFRAWLLLRAMLYVGALPLLDAELVVLRVARLRGCEYELQQHGRFAERRGLDAGMQAQIFGWPDSDQFSPRQQALLTATDEFVERRTISPDTWAALSQHLHRRQLIEFCMLAGQYDALAAVISSLQIPSDFPKGQR